MTKPGGKHVSSQTSWSNAMDSVLNESLATAFWSRHVDGKTDVSVKSAYTQATGLPAPTVRL